MNLPSFLKKEGNSLIYNQDNSTFVFYVPANYFNNTSKVNIAVIIGEYVSFIGVCNWAIIDEKGNILLQKRSNKTYKCHMRMNNLYIMLL